MSNLGISEAYLSQVNLQRYMSGPADYNVYEKSPVSQQARARTPAANRFGKLPDFADLNSETTPSTRSAVAEIDHGFSPTTKNPSLSAAESPSGRWKFSCMEVCATGEHESMDFEDKLLPEITAPNKRASSPLEGFRAPSYSVNESKEQRRVDVVKYASDAAEGSSFLPGLYSPKSDRANLGNWSFRDASHTYGKDAVEIGKDGLSGGSESARTDRENEMAKKHRNFSFSKDNFSGEFGPVHAEQISKSKGGSHAQRLSGSNQSQSHAISSINGGQIDKEHNAVGSVSETIHHGTRGLKKASEDVANEPEQHTLSLTGFSLMSESSALIPRSMSIEVATLYERNRELGEIEIHCGGHVSFGFRTILMARSRVFRKILANKPRARVNFETGDWTFVKELMDQIHTDKCAITSKRPLDCNDLVELFELAAKLEMDSTLSQLIVLLTEEFIGDKDCATSDFERIQTLARETQHPTLLKALMS